MKGIITAALILATPGLAVAESWVLWETTQRQNIYSRNTGRVTSKPSTVGNHDSKAACLDAAKSKVEQMGRYEIDLEGLQYEESVDGPPLPFANGHGYMSSLVSRLY